MYPIKAKEKTLMKHLCRKLVSMLLAVLLCVQLLPAAVMAALIDNSPSYNRQILSALEEIVGSEEEAERYYAILQQYGLLDEDGSVPNQWEIYMDGEQVTLDEVKTLLDEPDCDLTKQLLVDGAVITLGDLQTMLEIEDYITYLRTTYFNGAEWTEEQKKSLESLAAQIESQGIQMYTANDGTVFPSGVSHNAQVTVSAPKYDENGATAVFTVTLTHANEGQAVTFHYAVQSGSQKANGPADGAVTLTAGADGTASTTIEASLDKDYDTTKLLTDMDLTWFLQLYGLKNALFQNGKSAMTITCRISGTVKRVPTETNFNITVDFSQISGSNKQKTKLVDLSEDQQLAIQYGLTDHADMSRSTFTDSATGKKGYGGNAGTLQLRTDKTYTFAELNRSNGEELGYLKRSSLTQTEMSDNVKEQGTVAYMDVSVSGLALRAMFKYEPGTEKHYDLLGGIDCGAISSEHEYNAEKDLSAGDAAPKLTITANSQYLNVFRVGRTDEYARGHLMNVLPDEYEPGTKEWLPNGPIKVILDFTDSHGLSITDITAPAGTYYPGQAVPIVLTYSKPVDVSKDVTLKIAGETLTPVEKGGAGNQLTFLYTVKDVDTAALPADPNGVTATGVGDSELQGLLPGQEVDRSYIIPGVTLNTPNKADAITGLTAEVKNAVTAPVLRVTASLNSDPRINTWLAADMEPADGGGFQSKSLAVSVDGGATKYPLTNAAETLGSELTASIPLELNTSGEAVTAAAELYLNGDLVIGKYASARQDNAVFVTEEDIAVHVGAYKKDNNEWYWGAGVSDTSGPIYAQDEPVITATFDLEAKTPGKNYSFGNRSNITTLDETGVPLDGNAHFAWSSSDSSVANIDRDGNITPTGKSGSAYFTLTAFNGGIAGKQVTKNSASFNFGAGLTPFLTIPAQTIRAAAGQDVTVFWSSNLCDKNGETPTTFRVTVNKGAENMYTADVAGTQEKPAGSVTIPGHVLTYDYQNGSNRYKVTVQTEYGGKTYAATVDIDLSSKPAQVALDKLSNYYITDTAGTVNIGWNITNFDRYFDKDGANLFEFIVTKDGKPVDSIKQPGTDNGGGSYSGSYALPIDSFSANNSNPTSYRQVYTVTVQAKNGTDSTWSYDSFLLYVYDADALKLWVDGKDAGSSLTMSNVESISKMSQEQILALKRDIYLKNIISVNYGEYAWTELADQIAWHSSDSGVASVNYQQGTLYENIENFSYISYRPTTELGLSGLSHGSTKVTATHKLTGMNTSVDVTVNSLENKLYIFQCYPQATTTLRYQDSNGTWKEQTSDATGAAAIFEENGILGNVYCTAEVSGVTYLGTFYGDELKTGEGDWTKLERYPCNNLKLRRAAYAYLYVKNPDGTPYTDKMNFRGGVYVNGKYIEKAQFRLNDSLNYVGGAQDNAISVGSDGKLTVVMDRTQWGIADFSATDQVSYVFEISQSGQTEYYPMLLTVNANVNEDDFVGSGEAIVNFRNNTGDGKHPFVALQTVKYANYGVAESILDESGKAGPNDSLPEATLTTAVMWWGEDMTGKKPKIQLVTEDGVAVAAESGQFSVNEITYPFTESAITQYSVKLNRATMDAIPLKAGRSTGLYLDYYEDGRILSRRETMSFRLCNMLDMGKVEESNEIGSMLATMGKATAANAGAAKDQGKADRFFNAALNLVAGDSYSAENEGLFRIQLVPTKDAAKFLGFISVNVGNMSEDQVSGVYTSDDTSGKNNLEYTPGLSEMMVATGKKSPYSYLMDDYNSVLKRRGLRGMNFQFGGYAESLIYYNELSGLWEIQILNGGFNAGGGVNYTWNWNTMCGPVPFTATLAIGATTEISMDTLSVAYWNETTSTEGIGNDFLTELRIYLYLRFFAGVGIDYAVVAFKLGIFGQISADLQFRWLNRPYMYNENQMVINYADGLSNQLGSPSYDGKMAGQHFKVDGQIGLEFIARILFFSYEKILFSKNFNLLNSSTGKWDDIQTSWKANSSAQKKAISALLGTNSLTASNVGGQQMFSLNLAPTLESRDYLNEWESCWNSGGISLFSLDKESGLHDLQTNAYPYANPLVSDDGELVVYLADMGSTNVEDTRVAFATKNSSSYQMGSSGTLSAIDDNGFGDSQVSLSGTKEFAVAAWTRQMDTVNKDAGSLLTNEDQMIMMNSSEIYAAIYQSDTWKTTRLTENTAADIAPVTATNGTRAIVAWRAVASSGKVNSDGYADVADFDEQDMLLYRIYDGSSWSDAQVLYNGTSGSVKGIAAAMLDDGTAAVAYALDTDNYDKTLTDREIYYAVVGTDGSVVRNVRATNDAYLDENPQLATVTFPSESNVQRFVLGWYTEQSAMTKNGDDMVPDLRLMDFDNTGSYCQVLPDSISQAADAEGVSITPTFRFTKGAKSINDLSVLWVERAEGSTGQLTNGSGGGSVSEDVSTLSAERDVLKGVKFYTYGQRSEIIGFTGAVDVAEMEDSTLIDHFDAYVSDSASNEIKAVILGSTYGADGIVTCTATAVGGETVSYTVPSRMTAMYTATETYADKIEVTAVLADYDTVKKGAQTQIRFTVKNRGIHAVNKLEFTVGDTKTSYEDLNLLPGGSIQLSADYVVPSNGVVDPNYTVKATFGIGGASGTAKTTEGGFLRSGEDLTTAAGTVYLDLPDVQITEAKIVSEQDGKRTIQIKLNNGADASTAKTGRSVKLGFYSDATCETPITTLGTQGIVTISDSSDLQMLDEGGYSVQVTLDVSDYLKTISFDVNAPLTEIPDSGIGIFMKAEVVETENNGENTLPEPVYSNNYANVTCDNLAVRTGTPVSVTSDLSLNDSGSTVMVSLRNNRLSAAASGNVIITLLDQNGNVLAQQQSYNASAAGNGLIALGKEEMASKTFSFVGVKAASARVVYSDAKLNSNSNALSSLSLDGVTLDYDEATKTYTGSGTDLGSELLTIVVEDPVAAISVNGTTYTGAQRLSLSGGENRIEITVGTGENAQTYYLVVTNIVTKPSGGGSYTPTYPVDAPDKTEHGRVNVSPKNASKGDTVTITVKPDGGCVLETIMVIDKNGNELKLTDQGNGKYTFVMPSGKVVVKATFMEENSPLHFFYDVPNNAYYYEAVKWAVENAITTGVGNNLFAPGQPCTRAQIVTFLWRTAGSPEPKTMRSFSDVPANSYYAKAVAWAVENGITTGTGDGKFSPNATCTRAQSVTFLYRAMGTTPVEMKGFTDVAKGSYYADAVAWAVENGVTNGIGNGLFSPDGGCTRAQIVTFLYRTYQGK